MVDYSAGVDPHKQMAGMPASGTDGGSFGIAPLSSHMGRAHPEMNPPPVNHPSMPDHQRGHRGHHRRSVRAALDGPPEHGGADHGPLDFHTPDQRTSKNR